MKTRHIYYTQPAEIERFKRMYFSCLFKVEEKPFRTCKARVARVGKYIYLRSYNTVVAFIDTVTNHGYDILRTEYGYTATSAQHISKFFSYYSVGTVYRTDYNKGCCITKVLY